MRRSLLILPWVCLLLSACDPTQPTIELSGPAQGTTYSVKIVDPPDAVDANAIRVVVDDVLRAIDMQMSGYRDDSEISRFNHSHSTEWFEVSPDVATVVAAAQRVSELSDGALDVTVAPLVNLWGMGPEGEHADLPREDEIAAARGRAGYRNLMVREKPPALRKALPELAVDLNSVAPGYTVDLLASRFAGMGLRNFMIDLGGEVRAQGRNAQGERWRIAVEQPREGAPQPYAIASLDNASITTSGEYRHFIVRDGRRYSHTIDPRTGWPVEHRLASVAVIGSSTLEIDAWATALNVLGAEQGYEIALERQMPVMFIIDAGHGLEHRMTPQFELHVQPGSMAQAIAQSGR